MLACFLGLKFSAIGFEGSWVFFLLGVEALVGWLLDHSDVQVTEFSDADTVSDEYSDEEVVEDVDDTPYPVVSGSTYPTSFTRWFYVTFLHLSKEPVHALWPVVQDLPTALLYTEQSCLFCCWDNDWFSSIKFLLVLEANENNWVLLGRRHWRAVSVVVTVTLQTERRRIDWAESSKLFLAASLDIVWLKYK